MATVTISCADDGPFTEGATITLQASVDGGTATAWEWTLDGELRPGSDSSRSVVVATDTSGAWVATAALDGGAKVPSTPFPVAIKPPAGDGGAGGNGRTTETPPWFDTKFAMWAALVSVPIAVILVVAMGLFDNQLRLSDSEWVTLDARAKVANRIVLPIVVLGAIAVLVGMWMAAVEWRGRFEKPNSSVGSSQPEVRGPGDDAAKIIDSVGKLRGAALVMVVGALLMFAAAWVTQSTAKPPASPTTTTSATDPP